MSRKPKKYHYIYKTTCKVTGKFYVGMHSTDNLEDDYLGSGKILGYSRKKYGDENHVREILEFCSSRDELKQREKEIVNEALLADPLNINLKYGGEGGWMASASRKGALSEKRNHVVIQQKTRLTLKQRGKITGGYRGVTPNWKGRKHSNESKDRMSRSQKGKHIGQRNSQYATKWVSNILTGENTKIHRSELIEYPWVPGRNVLSRMKRDNKRIAQKQKHEEDVRAISLKVYQRYTEIKSLRKVALEFNVSKDTVGKFLRIANSMLDSSIG